MSSAPSSPDETLASRMRRRLELLFEMQTTPSLPSALEAACKALVRDGAENCTLVALTVVCAVSEETSIRPDIIQAQAGGHDFRSLYKRTVMPVLISAAARLSVPWRPSADPFVSNPFRVRQIDEAWVARRKNKLKGAEALCSVVSHVKTSPLVAGTVLGRLIGLQLEKLQEAAVNYRIPPRLNTAVVMMILTRWLTDDTGGRRHEALGVALLRFAGPRIHGGWDSVDSHHVNDPAPYDALCRNGDTVRLVGQVKDQDITAEQLRQLATQLQEHHTRRGFLLTRNRWITDVVREGEGFSVLRDQDILGLRIDVLDVLDTARYWLPLLDQAEESLPSFMRTLADELDNHSIASDRRALARLLDQLISNSSTTTPGATV
jgi:hypothetical protein